MQPEKGLHPEEARSAVSKDEGRTRPMLQRSPKRERVAHAPSDRSMPSNAEGAIDRSASSAGGRQRLQQSFQYIPVEIGPDTGVVLLEPRNRPMT